MKSILVLISLVTTFWVSTVVSSAAFASENKLVFTSFVMTAPDSKVAEICGRVEGSDESSYSVKLVVDPKSSGPAIYNVAVGPEKKFCTLVLTHTRRVEGFVR